MISAQNKALINTEYYEERSDSDDDSKSDIEEQERIDWVNIIFLPFQTWWKVIMLFIAMSKCILGPLLMVFPIFECTSIHEENDVLFYIRLFHSYITTPLYAIDTFLYIAHRQITEEAMKREYPPKSGIYLFFDILSIVPIYNVLSDDFCGPLRIWPNIIQFNESLVIYRVGDFFSLNMSHKVFHLLIGYTLLIALIAHNLNCFHLMMTLTGYCENCLNTLEYDWRNEISEILENHESKKDVYMYWMGYSLVMVYLSRCGQVIFFPKTYLEFVVYSIIILFGYLGSMFTVDPKVFAEYILRSNSFNSFHSRVKRIVEEAQRRDPESKASEEMTGFFSLLWMKKKGTISIPTALTILPVLMQTEVMLDLSWPIFHHSPTFRKTSLPFKRWLSNLLIIQFKQPGKRFFVGKHCFSNLYYVNSGIVQLLSPDDSTAPLLSMSTGTIFGDISFLIPPTKRKVIVRCLTYCEVLVFKRVDILAALHKFPEDRRNIMALIKERMNHAQDLYACKRRIKGKDRTEDEGLSWLKRRWWEISKEFKKYKINKSKKKIELDPEEHSYHCPKYIGQLVLCEEIKLQKETMFTKITFPWRLSPTSSFVRTWNQIVLFHVYMVLIIFPPNLAREIVSVPLWFSHFKSLVDVIFLLDILVFVVAGSVDQEDNTRFLHLRSPFFAFDCLSTVLVEYISEFFGVKKYLSLVRFNRLLKVYMLFFNRFGLSIWHRKCKPEKETRKKVLLFYVCFQYIISYFIFLIINISGVLDEGYWFETLCLDFRNDTNCTSQLKFLGVNSIFGNYMAQLALGDVYDFAETISITDEFIYSLFLTITAVIYIIIRFMYISTIYLAEQTVVSYQIFVTNLKKHFIRLGIHPDLMKRLERYLDCHWSHYQGMDIIQPTLLKDEPYDIYYKLHGELAEKIIGESIPFKFADPALIIDLAEKAKYLILPEGTTLIMFGSQIENATWLVNGTLSCEYKTETGDVLNTIVPAGNTLSLVSVLLNRASLKTYTAATDVEILCIPVDVFLKILRSFPTEWSYIERTKDEVGPLFDQMFVAYVKKHRSYQKKLQQEIFHAKTATAKVDDEDRPEEIVVPKYFKNYRLDPESKFIRHWLLFRASLVFIKVLITFIRVGSNRSLRIFFGKVLIFVRILYIVDMLLKMCLPYYDKNGLVVTKIRKCALHYMTRGFTADVVGLLLSWSYITENVFLMKSKRFVILAENFGSILHTYLVTGCFNYWGNRPSTSIIYIEILKWFSIFVLCATYGAIYLMYLCASDKGLLLSSCWIPKIYPLSYNLTETNLRLIQMCSLSVIQTIVTGSTGMIDYNEHTVVEIGSVVLVLTGVYWVKKTNCLALLLLLFRGESVFHQEVNQLKMFLKDERVDKETISRSLDYFTYWWKRTSGVDMRILMNERIGAVFKQDLNYYFFKKTLKITDTLLRGGEVLERMMARCIEEVFFLASEDVVRENQLSPHIYIVHRGQVVIRRRNKDLIVLSKGSIFGQLDGTNLRPLRITARTTEAADLLMITVDQFQKTINEDVRHRIKHNDQSRFDFMALRKPVPENPYNSIPYLLRGAKVIKLPYMSKPVTSDTSKWYERWLTMAWLIFPVTTFTLLLYLMTNPYRTFDTSWQIVVFMDVMHLFHMASDFYYTMELFVVRNRCIYRYTRVKKFFVWWYYLDLLSLVLPMVTLNTDDWEWQLARLFRSHSLYFYYKFFCKSFKDKTRATLLKVVILFLLVHALTCGWVLVACKPGRNDTIVPVHLYRQPKSTFDESAWTYPDIRGSGCYQALMPFEVSDVGFVHSLLVPVDWRMDYVVSLFCVICSMTHSNNPSCMALDIYQYVYKIFLQTVLFFIELWITSVIVSNVYIKFKEMYFFDGNFSELMSYLRQHGVSKYLIQGIHIYTRLLWEKQKGCWLPELTKQAPLCLREDIMTSLYIHHLLTPQLFQKMPMYFLKQVAVRMKRTVFFPGKYIVREGNICPMMYFVHEGEVEKWYTDQHGDSRLGAVLAMNGYFGLLPGLFPNTPYLYSYYTRTVVDLVSLRYSDWLDILNGYPELKFELYVGAMKMRRRSPKKRSGPKSKTELEEKKEKK